MTRGRRMRTAGIAALVTAAFSGLLVLLAPVPSAPRSAANPVTPASPGAYRVLTGRAYAEYRAAQHTLGPLPQNAAWPVGVPAQTGYGAVEGGLIRPGSGTDPAYYTYLCAWESEMLADRQSGDTARLAVASRRVGAFFFTPWARHASPDGRWQARVILPTAVGDYAGVEVDRPGTCLLAGIAVAER